MSSGQRYYRLWCGSKRHSHWIESEDQVWRLALKRGLAYGSDDAPGLGPLTWIEHGERPRAKARTISLGRYRG